MAANSNVKYVQPVVYTNKDFRINKKVPFRGTLTGKEEQLRYLQSCRVWLNDSIRGLAITNILKNPRPFESIIETRELDYDVIHSLLDFLTSDDLLRPEISSNRSSELVNRVYSKVISSKLFTSTLNLTRYISDIFECVTIFGSDDIQLIRSITELLGYLLRTFPSEYPSLSSTINTLYNHIKLDPDTPPLPALIVSKINTLYIEYRALRQRNVKIQSIETQLDQFESNRGYGIPYREMSILPSHAEVIQPGRPKLRSLLKTGPYPTAETYMDVLFKLLREDMLSPLRTGIQLLLARSESARKELYMYDKVRNLGIHCSTKHGILYTISLEPYGVYNPQHIQWDKCSRLKFGTLVCITPKLNNLPTFETTLWGVVADRTVDYATNSVLISIKFSGDELNFEPDVEYFMVESRSVYFEAYSHTLSVIQQTIPEEIPMKEVILGHTTHCDHPKYITSRTTFDFSEVFPNHENLSVLGKWPSDNSVLDPSQQSALRLALTKQLALIQGPPGTGKTFIGAHTIKILLNARNKMLDSYSWKNSGRNKVLNSIPSLTNYPILIVTYTNHALDQFLVYLLDYEENLVRIGSRIEQEVLETKTLYEARTRIMKKKDRLPSAIKRVRLKCGEIRGQLNHMQQLIETVSNELAQINQKSLTENDIARFATVQQYQSLFKSKTDFKLVLHKNKNMCDYWLYGSSPKVVSIQKPREINKQNYVYVNKYFLDENQFKLLADADGNSDEEDGIFDRESFMARRVEYLGLNSSEIVSEEELGVKKLIEQGELGGSSNNENNYVPSQVEPPANEFDEILKFERIFNQDSENENSVIDRDYLECSRLEVSSDDESEPRELTIEEALANIDGESLYSVSEVPHQLTSCTDLWLLDSEDKFRLYHYWLHKKKALLKEAIDLYSQEYSELAKELQECNIQIDSFVLQGTAVIGMTTTGAARNSELLKRLEPRIIFVEEAAEVLEAHIISSLSKHLEHLILIGDHQQLRPSNAVYELAVNYNLNLSLFERLINNKVEHVTLQCQHRMRPEISKLIVPIYPSLQDHPEVLNRDFIKGVASNIFFIDHSVPEDKMRGDTTTKSNMHEARFVSKLAVYLSKQGYSEEEITILTFYQGQKFRIEEMLRQTKPDCEIRVSTVDKFQGEENTIIIFSVVRSNYQNNIGYCRVENRVCVALSRARDGFFIIGNSKCLLEASRTMKSDLWHLVLTNFNGNIGDKLKLCCQKHPKHITYVKTAEDFRNVRNGGCSLPCNERMDCGHKCELLCHPYDHEKVQCNKPCVRILPCGHYCIGENGKQKLCSEDCGPCTALVDKQLDGCGHYQKVSCCTPPDQAICTEPCSKVLACLHRCSGFCGNDCKLINCQVRLESQLVCGHKQLIPCYLTKYNKLILSCKEKCDSLLECGHPCIGTCGSCVSAVHQPCGQLCNRRLVCGHLCQDSCHRPYSCAPCKELCRTRCVHGRCKRACGDECSYCDRACEWVCPSFRCRQPCSEPCDRNKCFKRCSFRLECGHKCIGICGEPCPPVCPLCSPEDPTFDKFFGDEGSAKARFVVLEDCHHIFEQKGLDRWMESQKDSEYKLELPKCPRCSVPVVKNLRYGTMIKSIQSEIELAKKKARIKTQKHIQGLCEQVIARVQLSDYLRPMCKILKRIIDIIPLCDNSKLSVIKDLLQILSDASGHPEAMWLHEKCHRSLLGGEGSRNAPYVTSVLSSAEYHPGVDEEAISNFKRLATKCSLKVSFEKAFPLKGVTDFDFGTLIKLKERFESSLNKDVFQSTPDLLSICSIFLNNFLRKYDPTHPPFVSVLCINRPIAD